MPQNAEYHRILLNESGLEMLNLCISQIEKATEAFLTHDTDLAEEVMNTETRVNALDLKIENDCEKFLALYNPVAIDLRFIMAILKINFDLERIADHAYGISKYIIDQDKKIDARLFDVLKFDVIYETITSMFDDITTAYETKDASFARKVFKGDFDNGKRGFFTSMKSDYVAIEILGLYWHFVDLVWVFVFTFFYLV